MDSSASARYCYDPALRWNPEVESYLSNAYGADSFSRISKALTTPSRYSCIRVNTLLTSVNEVIEKLRGILNETGFPNASLSKCEIPGLQYVIFVDGEGPNEINYNPFNESILKEVIVSRKCGEAVLRGAQVFVPGVMACSAHVEKGDEVAVSVAVEKRNSTGEWNIPMTRGTVLYGSEIDSYYHERRGFYIGKGTTTMSRSGVFRAAEGIAVDMHSRVFTLPSLHDVMKGEIFLQNLPSIITAHTLDPQSGENILDMCAAPGGKTTAIALLMKDQGQIFALDRSHNKVLRIQNLASEMGLSSIKSFKMDSLKAAKAFPDVASEAKLPSHPPKEPDPPAQVYASKALQRKALRKMKNGPGRNQCLGERVEHAKRFDQDSFDRVLLDAPCSALGLRPRLFAEEETVDSLRRHAVYQRRMFDQAVKLVRSGGVIVYSTCTINPGENEALVRYALDNYKFLSLAPPEPKVGGPGLVGRYESPDGFVEEWLRDGEEQLVQRFDPSSSLETIGFFIAKFNVGAKNI